jgi:hypothetical protein
VAGSVLAPAAGDVAFGSGDGLPAADGDGDPVGLADVFGDGDWIVAIGDEVDPDGLAFGFFLQAGELDGLGELNPLAEALTLGFALPGPVLPAWPTLPFPDRDELTLLGKT